MMKLYFKSIIINVYHWCVFKRIKKPTKTPIVLYLIYFQELDAIGHLQIKVYRAKGLYAADMGGKSDPYVVLGMSLHMMSKMTIFGHMDFKQKFHYFFL